MRQAVAKDASVIFFYIDGGCISRKNLKERTNFREIDTLNFMSYEKFSKILCVTKRNLFLFERVTEQGSVPT